MNETPEVMKTLLTDIHSQLAHKVRESHEISNQILEKLMAIHYYQPPEKPPQKEDVAEPQDFVQKIRLEIQCFGMANEKLYQILEHCKQII